MSPPDRKPFPAFVPAKPQASKTLIAAHKQAVKIKQSSAVTNSYQSGFGSFGAYS